MENNDFFGTIYDGMNRNYRKLEDLLSYLYQNKDKEIVKEIMDRLVAIGIDMTSIQKDLVSEYGDSSIKQSLIDNLDERTSSLSQALEQIKTR